jgi:hypothetical protein
MGVLDDAIREHLELKRRRGADEADLARQESEALGPVVRNPPAEEPSAELHAVEEPTVDELQVSEPFEVEIAHDDEPEPELTQVPEPEPEPEPDPVASQETAQFSSEDVAEALGRTPRRRQPPPPPEPAEEHDELEETPEFLQEAPEHDRLWFEQKPPKDFEF